MDYKNIHAVVKGLEFTIDEATWINGVVNNPVLDKLIAALLSITIEEERGLFKKALSPDEVSAILLRNHVFREVVADLKSDMISVVNTVKPVKEETEQEELPLTHIASGDNLAIPTELKPKE